VAQYHRLSAHKPFNPNLSSAAWHFLLLAGLVFAFWWLVRLAALPLYRKMGQWGRHKNRDRSNWLQLPATIAGAFIFDLLLLALTLFVGQMLSDRNGGNPTIAFQQSLFLNAFALIEFLKPFCGSFSARACRSCGRLTSAMKREILEPAPERAEQPDWLRPDRRGADYLQPGERSVGALANVVIMLCITLWALYLIFHNKN
jgi:hypothetical protein